MRVVPVQNERHAVESIVFDLDGTLYDEPRIYDRYAQELARYGIGSARDSFLAEWERAKRGESPARVGMGYDRSTDRLFEYDVTRITAFVRWDGSVEPVPPTGVRTEGGPDLPTVEVPIFGPDRISIGDWWALPDVIAAHHGVAREERQMAFDATRRYMAEAIRLQSEWEPELRQLTRSGYRLTVMSNSPAGSVADVVAELDIGEYVPIVIPEAQKPLGLTRLLSERNAASVLSIGDNFVNDIEPVLREGGVALYIDRHGTGLGAGRKGCISVSTIADARQWVRDSLFDAGM